MGSAVHASYWLRQISPTICTEQNHQLTKVMKPTTRHSKAIQPAGRTISAQHRPTAEIQYVRLQIARTKPPKTDVLRNGARKWRGYIRPALFAFGCVASAPGVLQLLGKLGCCTATKTRVTHTDTRRAQRCSTVHARNKSFKRVLGRVNTLVFTLPDFALRWPDLQPLLK